MHYVEPGKHTCVVCCNLREEQRDMVKDMAALSGKTVSAIIRELIDEAIVRMEERPDED